MSGNRTSNRKSRQHATVPGRPAGSPGMQTWRLVMIGAAAAVVAISLAAAFALGAFHATGSAASDGANASTPASQPAPPGSQGADVCLAGQACSGGLPYAQPAFLAVAMPMLEAKLHRSEAQLAAAMNNGISPTKLAGQAGLTREQWYKDEADAFTAGLNALIARNQLTVPPLASHPEITTPRAYRDYMRDSIMAQGADLELCIALGVNPLQAGIMP